MPDYLTTTIDKFTFKVAIDRRYSPEGLWVKEEGGLIRLGLADYLQQRSGDIAFVDIKPIGTVLAVEDELASIETIKINASLLSPVAGKVARVNPEMQIAPEKINQDPFGEGWLCEIDASNWGKDRAALLDAPAYFDHMKQEAEKEAKKL
jgi:glycine cleavage system H protein